MGAALGCRALIGASTAASHPLEDPPDARIEAADFLPFLGRDDREISGAWPCLMDVGCLVRVRPEGRGCQVARETLRIQKTLEDANLKITGVISDLLGRSGRAILRALIAGQTDPEALLAETTGRLKAPRSRLLDGLRGLVTDHHRFLLRLHLDHIEHLESLIAEIEGEVQRKLEPFDPRSSS
jgi:hypothetical protein